jgi:hypothetical protein
MTPSAVAVNREYGHDRRHDTGGDPQARMFDSKIEVVNEHH